MNKILDNVDLLILSAAFLSLIATIFVYNKEKRQTVPHPEFGHMTGPTLLFVVLTALLFLTWLTVAVSYVDMGGLNVVVAMGVATVKATLVSLYFMHLRWDRPFNSIIFVVSLLFLGVFLGFALLDTAEYNSDLLDDPFLKINTEQFGGEQG